MDYSDDEENIIYGDYDDGSLKLKVKSYRHVVMINTMSLPHIGIKVRVSDIQLINRCWRVHWASTATPHRAICTKFSINKIQLYYVHCPVDSTPNQGNLRRESLGLRSARFVAHSETKPWFDERVVPRVAISNRFCSWSQGSGGEEQPYNKGYAYNQDGALVIEEDV